MKRIKSLIGISAVAAMALSTLSFSVSAENEEYIYGTMNIPYAEFYNAELSDSVNSYDVDAVSSATTAKWLKNGEGELFEGTYNQANEDGSGSILGVTYPVAITQAELDLLGENNYSFTELAQQPSAYKVVSVENGTAIFSAVNGSDESISGAEASITTATPWGDYLLTIGETPDIGVIYGAFVNTENGEKYAFRHLENIWRGEFAWSTGFVTSEPHGNTLSYENFAGIMGETINQIVYITADGYKTLDTSLYVDIKFDGSLSVENADISAENTSFSLTGFPEDYNTNYEISNLETEISDGIITFKNAMPGLYTLSASDSNGIYMDLSAEFELTTDTIPAEYDNRKLIKKEEASDEEFQNFISNISAVSVNGTSYNASGRKSTVIILPDGTVDTAVVSNNKNVFSGSEAYEVEVTASGYTSPVKFTITENSSEEEATVTTNSNDSSLSSSSSNNSSSVSSSNNNSSSSNSKSSSVAVNSSKTSTTSTSPATGDKGIGIFLTALSAAMVTGAITVKKAKK